MNDAELVLSVGVLLVGGGVLLHGVAALLRAQYETKSKRK